MLTTTGSGKTVWTRNLIANKERLFKPEAPRCVIFFYRQWQPIYTEMQESGLVHLFIEGIPEEAQLKELFSRYKQYGGCICILDDLADSVNDTVTLLFTVLSHHLKVTVILLVQSLFLENKLYRTCSLNAHYIVLMKNKRDGVSVSYLARQISPYHSKYITESFMKATQTPYSYLLFDMRQETNDLLRLRTNIFSYPVHVYIENTNKKNKK
jgi:hypothetical protein